MQAQLVVWGGKLTVVLGTVGRLVGAVGIARDRARRAIQDIVQRVQRETRMKQRAACMRFKRVETGGAGR